MSVESKSKPKYTLYDDGSKYHHKRFGTINLNPFGKVSQSDDIYQVLKVLRPDLSDREILGIITEERIRRAEMAIGTSAIERIIRQNLPDYVMTKVGKKHDLKEVVDMFDHGRIIIRMGTNVVVYDADTGDIYTGIKELYTMRPVTAYWEVPDEK